MNQGSLHTNDLKSQAETFLTRKAKAALEKKAYNQIVQDTITKETFICTYFGSRTKKSEIDDAIKMVASHINQLASKDLIHSCLSHFISFDLSFETTGYFDDEGNPKEQESVVVCYVLVPEKTHKELMDQLKAVKMDASVEEVPQA